MTLEERQELFRKFKNLVLAAVSEFYIWKYLQKSENNKAYNMRGWFRVPIITTLQQSFLLNLANLFDKDKRVLSVYILINKLIDNIPERKLFKKKIELDKYSIIEERLTQRRNNSTAHKNIEFTLNPSLLTEKFPFKYDDIEEIIALLIKFLEEIRIFVKLPGSSYDSYYKDVQKYCEQHTKFVLENGLNTEAYKKLQNTQENPE